MAKKKHLFSWTGHQTAKLSSASVEDGAATDVVLTFVPAAAVKAFTNAVDSDFALTGKTISGIAVDQDAGTLTVTVTVAYSAGAGFNLVYTPSVKGAVQTYAISNNLS